MNVLNMKEIKEIELSILKDIDAFCKKNNIKYSLWAGTMLGAIRHQGFIPWDDDIDIAMTRKEYEKFKKLVLSGYKIAEQLDLVFPLDDNYFYAFPKVIDTQTIVEHDDTVFQRSYGIWVDIFVIDYLDDDYDASKKILDKALDYFKYNTLYTWNDTISSSFRLFLKKILKKYFDLVGKNSKYWNKKILSLTNNKKSRYCGEIVCPVNNEEIYESEYFEDYIYVKFEDCEFPIYKSYKECLTLLYGDYMKLPPESERVDHRMKAYRIEDEK